MKYVKHLVAFLIDVLGSPLTLFSALWLKLVRRIGTWRTPVSRALFRLVGVMPIRDHYYEPLFQPGQLRYSLRRQRDLPGLDLNLDEQLALLQKFNFGDEIMELSQTEVSGRPFRLWTGGYGAGDIDYLYSMIRLFQPKRIVEVGSGRSTAVALAAIARNEKDDETYNGRLTCVEPYRCPHLEDAGVDVIRQRVEEVDAELFSQLGTNDILFIDTTHIICPQGDVLHLYLKVLPTVSSGVLAHIHDVFSPYDYLDEWVLEYIRFWNEQYLLEAFLCMNPGFKVLAATNFLKHNYGQMFEEKCPLAKLQADCEPGAFWIARC